MAKFEVVVSNVGTVHTGDNPQAAIREYMECVHLSKESKVGRIAGESVTLFNDGEIVNEYQGTQEND
jgi:hypothetical protein